MPATRKARTSGGPAIKEAQSTLSFGGRTRVTKNAAPVSKLSKDVTEDIKKAEVIVPELAVEVGHVTSEAAIEKQAKVELSKSKTEAEKLAEKMSDAQIMKYWSACEAERKASRGRRPRSIVFVKFTEHDAI